ncbi:MAG: hypothetical protein Q8R33_16530 [Burkholderiales bacterium]|nr:hypothetical protein [Burkholderiales bacterium]
MLSAQTQTIKDAIEQAFSPFRCAVEVSRYEIKLRFKVFDTDDQGIVEVSELIVRQLRDKSYLASVISSARDRVEGKEFSLAPWKP